MSVNSSISFSANTRWNMRLAAASSTRELPEYARYVNDHMRHKLPGACGR